MKTLLILRHAKSSWDNAHLADHERPLNERGQRDAPRMGRLLRSSGLVPDLIVSSSAERALTTAEAVALACDYDKPIHVTRRLYHALPDAYLAAVREFAQDEERVMVVGHNPGIEDLVERLGGELQRMPTAALAQVEFDISYWLELKEDAPCRLINLWRPKELDLEQ